MKELIKKGKEYYKKYREGLTYLIAGGIATILNIGVFALLTYGFKINYEISNIIAIIVAVLFQYISNKFFVFVSIGDVDGAMWQVSFAITPFGLCSKG